VRFTFELANTALCVFLLACGSSSSSRTPEPFSCNDTTAECLNALAGEYSGAYSGDASGTWVVRILPSGELSGTATNTDTSDTYTLSGTADENGRIVFGTVSDGSAFKGTLHQDFSISGTWEMAGARGTFRGKRDSGFGGITGAGGGTSLGDGSGGNAGAVGGSSSCSPMVLRSASESATCAEAGQICSANDDCMALACCFFTTCPLFASAERDLCHDQCWRAHPSSATAYFAACECVARTSGATGCMHGRPATTSGGTGGASGGPGECGNGILNGTGEQCDDSNAVSSDGCSATCQVEAGWACPLPGMPCQRLAHCGDGIVRQNEACDDGNSFVGDGCSETCRLEVGYECEGSPSNCSPVFCSDGRVEGTEGCDDGNAVSGDGCSENCQLEPSCSDTGCASRCGDGIIVAEECDDGNRLNGDGCSSSCAQEPGWMCRSVPSSVITSMSLSSCQSVCGDGIVVGTEQCDAESGCTTTCQWAL